MPSSSVFRKVAIITGAGTGIGAAIKPRKDIDIKRHAPFERWDNVIALAHESHP